MNVIFKISLLGLLLGACTPKLMIRSEPPQAEVYLTVEGRPEKVKAGETPLELTELQINEMLKITSENSQWIQISLEKKDFQKRNVSLPSNRWGELSKSVNLQLAPMDDTTTTATKMLKYFFNAKKFAETKQFEQAHAEIDKILTLDSQMPQALNMKAGIFFLQGNLTEARNLYRKALEIDPGSNEAIQMLERIQNRAEGARQ